MKKILFYFLILLFFQSSVFSLEGTIEGIIKYNETSARKEAFDGVEYKIKRDLFEDYLHDKNKKENLHLMKIKVFRKDNRSLCPFYLNETIISYAIVYDDNYLYTFYYNTLGSLVKVDVRNNENKYPKKVISYSRYGNLISIVFEASESEQFVYDKKGKLIARWIGNDMYDKEDNFPKFLKIKRGDI